MWEEDSEHDVWTETCGHDARYYWDVIFFRVADGHAGWSAFLRAGLWMVVLVVS